ncbi:YqaA family protein [Shewanella psychrotolerans]|uniref:YqaA family protein n=1 Tax=Shewanella psychrotolerans TaxID=2864206 RepID=UPI001C65736E|nr:YqaA family protein [Shewanella psychrotolerans]QYK02389.1 DedA family protein [Shewanella psychrotolerans]
MTALWLMFSAAFVAATLLPGGSEVLLVALLNEAKENWFALVVAATIGNTLGSVTSYYLGSLGRFATTPEAMAKGRYRHSISLIQRYGYWSLLLAWAPLIGDLLCLLAGWMKLSVVKSTLMIFMGKGVRYLLVAAIALHWL